MSLPEANIKCAWRAKKVNKRNAFLFNNELGSDVPFLVGGDAAVTIQAHKIILAIASQVFHAMFFGPIQEDIELPDVEPEAFLALLKYIYTDEIKLTDTNVFPEMYVASKYMVTLFEGECVQYLLSKLNPENAVLIYSDARRFICPNMESRCLKMIDIHAEIALKSRHIFDLKRNELQCIIERDTLRCNEMSVFNCVNKWARKQRLRYGFSDEQITGEVKRIFLGDLIFLVRFPTMRSAEFATGPGLSGILTKEEVLLHIHSSEKVSTPFVTKVRMHRISINLNLPYSMRKAKKAPGLRFPSSSKSEV